MCKNACSRCSLLRKYVSFVPRKISWYSKFSFSVFFFFAFWDISMRFHFLCFFILHLFCFLTNLVYCTFSPSRFPHRRLFKNEKKMHWKRVAGILPANIPAIQGLHICESIHKHTWEKTNLCIHVCVYKDM